MFLGPALRAQPDRRLVALVRQGYETAFEEIVRRYASPLGRYAAAIVPRHRAEDVTQDAFSKALLALRGSEADIQLRPWLFRIVRNTALNDLRDEPGPAMPLEAEAEATGSAYDAVARRAEVADLMARLRALPEPQRAAIVMRELEGLSHEEIAAALGITGGAARQVIYRARRALREGLGLLLPLPLMKLLLGGAAPAGAAAAGFGGAAAGGGGTAVAVKAAAASLLVAGTVGTGIALQDRGTRIAEGARLAPERAEGAEQGSPADPGGSGLALTGASAEGGDGSSGPGGPGDQQGDRSGEGAGEADTEGETDSSGPSSSSGPGPGGDGHEVDVIETDSSGPGPAGSGGSQEGSDSSGPGSGGTSGTGSSSGQGSGGEGSGSGGA